MIQRPIPWPGGAKCAVCITFDMDADSILHIAHPDDSLNRMASLSSLRYGPQVGVPRILDTYKEFGIKQTFFIPAWCMEQYPETVELILEGGHEIAHHGYIHEHPNELSRDEEQYWLKRSIEVIETMTGKRPRGWRAPLYNFSEHSVDLLIEEGFKYDASLMGDDVPYLIESGKSHLVELPSYWGMDDWPQFVQDMDLNYMMPIKSASQGIEVFRDEFDAMYEYGGLWVPVWHPFATGRLARWHQVRKLLRYMQDKGDVWFATMEEIASHVERVTADGSYKPRRDNLPYYPRPIRITR